MKIIKISEKLQKIIFSQKTKDAKMGGRVGPQGGHTPKARATLGRTYRGCGHPGPPLAPPSRLYLLLETLIHGEQPQKYSAEFARQKTPREKELSDRQISVEEIPSRRGEIVAINTIIKIDFI